MSTTTLKRPATKQDKIPRNDSFTKRLTFAEYMEIERSSAVKHNFIDGLMEPVWPVTNKEGQPVGGATTEHNTICGNIIASLYIALRGSGCRVLTSDQKIAIAGKYGYYPDVTVVCGTPEIALGEALLNPVLIVEVLSPSTQDKDYGTKFRDYRAISSLQHYILVSQFEASVEHWQCKDSKWMLFEEYKALDEIWQFDLDGLPITIPLDDIYEFVDFSEASDSLEGA